MAKLGECMESTITIEVSNWKRYNPRTDVEHSSWFRMNHSMLEDDDLYDFTHSEMIAWIYILSQASKKNNATLLINFDRAERVLRIKRSCFESAILKLEKLQMITVHDTSALRPRNVHDTSAGATDGRTDEREYVGLNPKVLFELWNSATRLPKAEKLSDKRIKQAKAQIAKYPDLEHWKRALDKFDQSDFCALEWKPTLDDFLSEDKRLKAIEGKYDRKSKTQENGLFPPINTVPLDMRAL